MADDFPLCGEANGDDEMAAAAIDAALSSLLELQSRRRVLQYLNAGWILPETADRILNALDEGCGV